MNPFENHGIKHLSASSLNLARHSLPLWLLHYLGGIKGAASMAMHAGQAIEDGVTQGLFHPGIPAEQCIETAIQSFRHKTALGGFDPEARDAKIEEIAGREAEGRKKAFDGFVRNALTALRPYGIPTRPENGHRQHKIEVRLDGIPVPVIGFKDFAFESHGLDVDLKTTSRMPEDMSPDHQLQAAIYWRASGNRAQRFCYVTKADHKVLELSAESAQEAINTATGIAHNLMRFLSLSTDWRELAGYTIPDYSTYRWDPMTVGSARDIWGF